MKRFAAVLASVALVVMGGLLTGCGRSSLGQGPLGGGFSDASPEGGPDGSPDGGHPGCRSNVDCASTPSTPYCEIPPGKCVACETTPQCPVGDVCNNHECIPACGTGAACGAGLSCCALGGLALCVNETTDPQDCGGCGRPCPPGEACVGSRCQVPASCNGGPVCSTDEQCCASGCSNTNSDPRNCGFCGRTCTPGST